MVLRQSSRITDSTLNMDSNHRAMQALPAAATVLRSHIKVDMVANLTLRLRQWAGILSTNPRSARKVATVRRRVTKDHHRVNMANRGTRHLPGKTIISTTGSTSRTRVVSINISISISISRAVTVEEDLRASRAVGMEGSITVDRRRILAGNSNIQAGNITTCDYMGPWQGRGYGRCVLLRVIEIVSGAVQACRLVSIVKAFRRSMTEVDV